MALLDAALALLIGRDANGIGHASPQQAGLYTHPKTLPASLPVQLSCAVPEASVEEQLVFGVDSRGRDLQCGFYDVLGVRKDPAVDACSHAHPYAFPNAHPSPISLCQLALQ